MKRILLAIIFLAGMQMAFSQDNPFYNSGMQNNFHPTFSPGGFQGLAPQTSVSPEKKMDVGVQLGTSFSTDFNKGFAFSTMVAPELRYRVNDRLTIRGGVSISNTEYGNTLVYSPYGASRHSGNLTQGMIYVSGDYMISPKVILSGTAYKEFSMNHSDPESSFSPGYDGKGLMMNLRLLPSDNMIIDIGAEFYDGNNPYRNGMYSPYGGGYRPFTPGF